MLAQELVDLIISFSKHDKGTLANCCLVCRDWTSSARCHLFADVFISSSTPKTFPLPVAVYVRRLMICHGSSITPDILPPFPSATSLYIQGHDLHPSTRLVLPCLFPAVTYLELCDIDFESLSDIALLVCSAFQLRALTLSTSWQEDTQPSTNIQLPFGLHSLVIRSMRLDDFLHWFNQLNVKPPLSILRLYLVFNHIIPVIRTTLNSFHSTLQTFEIVPVASEGIETIDLGGNIALRSLVLSPEPPVLFGSLFRSAMRQPTLERVAMTMTLNHIQDTGLLDWPTFDNLLLVRALGPGSVTVTIRLIVDEEMFDALVDHIKLLLPQAANKHGVLMFVSERERLSTMASKTIPEISWRSLFDEFN